MTTLYTSFYDSPLGMLRLQCNDTAIGTVVFSKEAGPQEDHPLLRRCAAQLDEYFSGTRKSFDLPLAQEGTGFQQQVWTLLCDIPYGKTISYQELSKQFGNLKAIRAVAAANGRNNIAIIVPCHRVIGSNQSLTGYAGGLWRKKWLLEHESKFFRGLHQAALFGEAE